MPKKPDSWRPPGYTGAVHAQLIEAAKAGHSQRSAASLAGVSESTLRAWLAKGRTQLNRWASWDDARLAAEYDGAEFVEREPVAGPLARLWVEWQSARAKAIDLPLRTMREACESGDVSAAKWLLARLEPERYGELRAAGVEGAPDTSGSRGVVGKMIDRIRS